MNRADGSARVLLAAAALIVAAALVSFGCETTVISSEGIGASTSHPKTSQPAGSDPLSERVWGNKN